MSVFNNYSTILYILLIIVLIYLAIIVQSNVARTFVILLVIIIALYFIYINYFKNNTHITSGITDATIQTVINSSELETNNTGAIATNFSYSIWAYIDDWSYNYGLNKSVLLKDANPLNTGKVPNINLQDEIHITDPGITVQKFPSPFIYFGAESNKLIIEQSVYSSNGSSNPDVDKVDIENIPLQKWVNILVSVYGRTLDTYIDGKLVNTHVLSGVPYIGSTSSNIYITPNGGFSGYRSDIQYYPNETDPQKAWDIYADGFTKGQTFNNPYTVEVSLYNNGTEQGSYTF
jgi:hypothetical protein